MRYVLWQIQPARLRWQARNFIGIELEEGIQADYLYSCQFIKLFGRNNLDDFPHCPRRAFIAVAKGIAKPFTVSVEAHIINRPTVNSDRRNAFRGQIRALAQACLDASKNPLDFPAQALVRGNRRVRKAVNDADFRGIVFPPKQRDAATHCAQIDRNESFPQAHNEYSGFARVMLMLT